MTASYDSPPAVIDLGVGEVDLSQVNQMVEWLGAKASDTQMPPVNQRKLYTAANNLSVAASVVFDPAEVVGTGQYTRNQIVDELETAQDERPLVERFTCLVDVVNERLLRKSTSRSNASELSVNELYMLAKMIAAPEDYYFRPKEAVEDLPQPLNGEIRSDVWQGIRTKLRQNRATTAVLERTPDVNDGVKYRLSPDRLDDLVKQFRDGEK